MSTEGALSKPRNCMLFFSFFFFTVKKKKDLLFLSLSYFGITSTGAGALGELLFLLV